MVRFRDAGSIAKSDKLTRDIIQEAPRTHPQPIKSDDPELDFCNRYERETMAHDDEYMKRDNEDNFRRSLYHCIALTSFLVRSVLGGQLRLRHRRPGEAPAIFRRTIGSIPPSNLVTKTPPLPQRGMVPLQRLSQP